MKGIITFILACALALPLLTGCAAISARREERAAQREDRFTQQTDSMRESMSPTVSEKKPRKKSTVLYGGVSSEAREIEDSLYAH